MSTLVLDLSLGYGQQHDPVLLHRARRHRPRLSLKRVNRTPDPQENPSHWIETIDFGIVINEHASSAVWARIQQLQSAIGPEGLLEILDGSGALTERRVSVLSNNVDDVIRAHRGSVSISVRAVVPIDADAYGTTQAATWQSGDATAVLRHVRQYREDISTETFAPDHPERLRTVVLTNFAARVFSAVPGDDRPTRQAALMGVKDTIVADLHRNQQGTLSYAGTHATMTLVNVTPSIDDQAQHLDLQLQFRREIFPGGGQVRYDYTTLESSDCTSGKITLTTEGKLLAPTRAQALAAIEIIKEKHQTGSNKQTRADVRDRWVRSGDAVQDKWLELSFTLIWEAQDDSLTHFSLRISRDVDHEQGEHRTTYTGTVTASHEGVARAKARELGQGKHPVIRSENEESAQSTDCDGNPKFESLTFTYVYATESDSAILSGSVTLQHQKPLLGDESTVISGQITASSYGAARALALTLLRSANHLSDSSETETIEISGDGQQWKRLDFSYTLAQARTRDVATRFTRESNPNFEQLIETISINGTIRAKTAADAKSAIEALIRDEGLIPVEKTITDDHEEVAGHTRLYRGTHFRLRFEKDVTDTEGYDILQASLTVTEVPQEAQDAITQTPFGLPVTHRGVTWNIGELSVSGSVRARTESAARTWAKSKRALVATRNGATGSPSPARLSTRHHFKRYETDTPTSYEVQFQFGFRYGRTASGAPVVTL